MRRQWLNHQFPDTEHSLWELYHENSKLSPYQEFPDADAVVRVMREMYPSLANPALPAIALPPPVLERGMDLGAAIGNRRSARMMTPDTLGMEDLSSLLFAAYGINRRNDGTNFPRPFRTVPSGGALYPLEIYVHTTRLTDGPCGLLHYDPEQHTIRQVDADRTDALAAALVEPDNVRNATALFIITALFDRSVFKYGNRGYRFILLEAGHVAQNLNLMAASLGRPMLNIGGFRDREVDRVLELNGLGHSTLYLSALSAAEAP